VRLAHYVRVALDIAGGDEVASLTIDDIEEELAARLRVRAAQHGRSVEDEAYSILRIGLAEPSRPTGADLADAIHELFAPFGGVDLEIPPRTPLREPPRFDERYDP
jgi:antitoxin FitA